MEIDDKLIQGVISMLSSNNWKEQIRKQEPKKQRFTIKKLTVGVASVLIGFTFMGASALADDNVTTDNSQNEPTNTAITNNNQTANSQATAVASTSEENSTANDSDAATTNTLNVQQAQTANVDASTLQESKDEVNNTENQAEVNDYAGLISALKDKNINTITLTGDIDDSGARGGYDTINTANIAHTVTIDGQGQYSFNMGNRYIYLTNNTESNNDHWNITFSNIKNIQAQNKYGLICVYSKDATKDSINFNNVTVDPSTKTLTGKNDGFGPVNVSIKNSTINGVIDANNLTTTGENTFNKAITAAGDINLSGHNTLNDTVSGNNVTTTGENTFNKAITTGNANFSGINSLSGSLSGNDSLVTVNGNLEINGTTTVTPTANRATNATSFSVAGNAIIDSGAKLNITSSAKNVAGITFTTGAKSTTIDNATAGVLRLMPNAQVTMSLGAGKSMAVMRASDIDLQDGSQLTVNTKMDTTGFRALAPIEVDSTQNDADDSTVRISNNAKLTIIRSGVTVSDSPLLSIGPNDGLGNSYHLLVNGGTLDLEDSAYSNLLPKEYTLTKNEYKNGWPGILTMWGTSSSDEISFNNAKMIKLVRTANNKPGYLIHTDSAGDVRSHSISVTINNTGSNAFTPLTMIPAGSNTPVTWNIKYLSTKSQGGDFAYVFRGSKNTWNIAGSEYMKGSVNDNIGGKNEVILAGSTDQGSNHFDNGQVVPENGKTTASPELNNFINHFSWWNCKGVSFGTDLQEVSGTVTYVDDAGKTVANKNGQNSLTFNFQKSDGLSADTLDKAISDNIPTNWKLKPGYALPGAQTDTFNIKVPIVHATQNVTPGDPGVTPDKTSYKDLFTTSTRTINVYKTDGTLDHAEKQTVTFGRTGILDKVTGDITVAPTSPWHVYNTTTNKLTNNKQGTWAKYDVPTHDGYNLLIDGVQSDTASVPAVNTVDPNKDVTVNVKYTATQQNYKQSIKYVDEQGHTLATTANAFTGTFTVTNPATISADQIKTQIKQDLANNHSLKGWVVAGNYPATETISEQTPAALVVTLKHGTKPVTPVDPGVNPNDTKYKDMFTTVTRKIYQTKPGKTEKLIDTQYVHFGRNGIEDLVSGDVTAAPNSTWEAGTIQDHKFIAGGSSDFASEPVEQIDNYDSYVDGVKTTTVSSDSALQNGQPTNGADVHITYVSNNQTTPVPYDPSNDQMNKYVTRTITVHKTDGKTATIKQTVHFVRGGVGQNAGTKDKNGNITWANWTVADNDNKSTGKAEGQWKEYDVPAVDGYTSTVDGKDATKVNAQDVDVDTPDANVTVAYTKTYNPTDPTINPNKPTDKYKNMYAHPTRTINVVNPVTDKTDTTSQVVWYGRTMTISSDPNVAVKYGDWTLGKVENDKFVVDNSAKAVWDEFTAPTFDGYTPSQSTVAANNNVTATTPNETVTITYVANHETTPIPYDPSNDQMNKYVTRTITVYNVDHMTSIKKQTVHFVRGGVGQNAGTKDKDGNITWTNWTVADNDNKSTGKAEGQWTKYDVPAVDGYTSTVDGQKANTVNAQTVTADTPDANVTVAYTKTYNPTDPTINPNNPTDQYKNMYAHPTRTIKVHNPQTGLISTANQTVWFGRTMTISSDPNVAVKYGDWTLGKVENNKFVADPAAQDEWGEFDAPTFTNYTPNIAKLNAQKVTATTKDEQVDITYTATKPVSNTYSQNIVYQTANGTVVETARGAISGSLINGSATVSANDANTAINDHMPAGYEYVSGKLTDAETITSAQPNALIVTVKANGPVTPTTTDAQQYEPSYKDTTVNATNPVNTGAPIFTKDGHQVSAPAGTKFSFSNGNTTMTINDKKNGNPVTATIDANTGAITFTAPDAATEYDVAVTVTYPDASTDPAVAKVFVNKTYDPTKVDPNDPNYENMFTTVTRDIITTDPTTGKDTTNTQKVTFGRTMTIHGDGSAPEYGAWEVGTLESPEAAQTVFMILAAGTNHTSFVPGGRAVFGSEPINQIPGYTSEVNGSPATEVPKESALRNGEPTNGTTIHVTYHKDGEKPTPTEGDVVITYVDKKNPSHVLGTTSVSGNTGSSVDVKSAIEKNVPAKWTLDPDYTIPTTAEVPGAIQVPLVHATKTVKPSDPGVNPSNPDDQDMFKTVTRTINVENPVTGNTDTHTQQVNFSRSKTIDEVTNEVLSYGAWTPAEGQWAEFDAPEFSGYTPSQAVVAAETVTADTADATVTITYKSNNGGNHNPGTNPQPGDHHNPGNNDHHNNGGNTNPGNNNGGQPTNTNHGNGNNAGDNTNDHSNAQNNKQALPQTGNTKDTAAVAGLGLAGLTALLGLGGRKKKEN